MTLPDLITALSDPRAYGPGDYPVEVRQTHISVVVLTADHAYKLKKPVTLGFLDFGTLEKRRAGCEREVALNRRLAPDIYLGVVPITRSAAGVTMNGDGETVEWAVKMRRLPDDATLLARLRRGEVTAPVVEHLGRQVAAFHASAEGGERVAAGGRFEAVAGNALENFAQAEPHVGRTVSRAVFDRVRCRTEAAFQRLRPLIDRRAATGVPRDTHGDLHLDHVYLFPDRPPPGDVVVIDCVEFNDRFRHADPVADAAFLAMDLGFHGRPDLAAAFADAYLSAAYDPDGRALLPFYTAYRAVVRAKVDGMTADDPAVPAAKRLAALCRGRAHWLYALGLLEPSARRPCLVLVGGLPGVGKSTLSAGLAGFKIIRSDVVRKELVGVPATTPSSAPDRAGIYTPELTELTYELCQRRAEDALFAGERVVVDASFAAERHRRAFLDAAAGLAVPGVFLHCQADPCVTARRLAGRRGDASDADEAVARRLAGRWEPSEPRTVAATRPVVTDGTPEEGVARATAHLCRLGLSEYVRPTTHP